MAGPSVAFVQNVLLGAREHQMLTLDELSLSAYVLPTSISLENCKNRYFIRRAVSSQGYGRWIKERQCPLCASFLRISIFSGASCAF